MKIDLRELLEIENIECLKNFDKVTVNLCQYDIPSNIMFSLITKAFVDIETTGLDMNRDRICKITIFFPDIDKIYILDIPKKFKKENYETFINIMNDSKILKVFHYAALDVLFIQHFFECSICFFCTFVASKIVRTYSPNHSLKSMCKELCSFEVDKSEQQTYWGNQIESFPNKKISYMVCDVIFLPTILESLNEIAKKEQKLTIIDHAMVMAKKSIILAQHGYPATLFFRD